MGRGEIALSILFLSSGGEFGGVCGSVTITGVEYDFFIGDGVRVLETLLWLEFVAIENADLDVDADELDQPSDELDVPDAGRANILGPACCVGLCT